MMVRQALIAAAVALAGLGATPAGHAQDTGAPPRRESLAERIERMRAENARVPVATPQPETELPSQVEWSEPTQLRTVVSRRGEAPPAELRPVAERPAPVAQVAEAPPAGAPLVSSRRRATVVESPAPAQLPAPAQMPAPAVREASTLQEKLSELRDVFRGRPEPRTAVRAQTASPTPARVAAQPSRAARPAPQVIQNHYRQTAPEAQAETAPAMTSSRRTANPSPSPRMAAQPSPHAPQQAADERILLTVQGPQIQARTLGPSRLVVGRAAEFTVMVSNDGDAGAEDVQVTVQLPPGVDVLSTDPSHGTAQLTDEAAQERSIHWQIDRLPASGSETVALRLVPRTSKPVELAVRYTYAQSSSTIKVEVEEPMLNMVISGPSETIYGQTKIFILTVSNPGTGDAENVQIRLLPLDGTGDATDSHTLGTLRRGETKTIPVELLAAKSGTLHVRAVAVAAGDLQAEAEKQVLVRRAALEVTAAGPPALYAGNAASYRVRVSNVGNAGAEGVTVTAALPTGAELTRAGESGQYDQTDHQVTWHLRSLPPGDTVDLQLDCTLTGDGPCQVRVNATDETQLTADAVASTNVIARADLKLAVSDPSGPVHVAERGVYEIHVSNRGTKAAEGVEVVVFFSEGIEPAEVEGGQYEIAPGQVVFQPIASLPPGGEVVYQIRAKAGIVGDHVFRAEVHCRPLGARLVAQETTHYYADFARTAERPQEPTPAVPLRRYSQSAGWRGRTATAEAPEAQESGKRKAESGKRKAEGGGRKPPKRTR